MSYNGGDVFGGMLVGAILGFVFGLIIGIGMCDSHWKHASVIAGHAEYVAKDGSPVWQWKSLEPEKAE